MDDNKNYNKDNDLQQEEYEDIYSDSTFIERVNTRKKKRKQEKLRRNIIISVIFVLLFGTVAAAALTGLLKNNSIQTQTEKTEESSSLKESSVESSEESKEESSALSFENSMEFKTASDVFSEKVKNELEKNITSGYVVLYDMTEDKILFQKNGSKKCYPASTTKMLTAIVSSKIIDKDTVITVGDEIELIGEDSSTAGLVKGMKMTFETLIDALLLPSGNDAAYTIAVNSARIYSGDETLSNEEAVKLFVELMNDAAKQIGCKNTHFVTPDGWHDDNHYTTAEDLARIAAYAKTIPLVSNSCKKSYAKWDLIKEESSSPESTSSQPEESSAAEVSNNNEIQDLETGEIDQEEEAYGDTIEWYNSNALLLSDSGMYSEFADGMKTGFTDEAGTSVVASATINGHTLIASVMNGLTLYAKYDDANRLFTEGFKLYGLDYQYG